LTRHNLNTFLLDSYLKSKILYNQPNDILFTWCRLSLKELVTAPLDSSKGIPVVCETIYGHDKVNILRPAVLRVNYGKDCTTYKNNKPIFGRFTYGLQSGSECSRPKKFVTKSFNYYLEKMATFLHKLLINNREKWNLQTVNLMYMFNHVIKLLYATGADIKKIASLALHCDIDSDHDGIYIQSTNAQMENTVTVIVVVGDSRNLVWERQVLTTTPSGRKKWVTDKTFNAIMVLNNISILIVNPLDEKATANNDIGLVVRYRHGGVKVKGSQLSVGFVFRVVRSWAVYDCNDELLQTGNNSDNTILTDIGNSPAGRKFHDGLNKLYDSTFET